MTKHRIAFTCFWSAAVLFCAAFTVALTVYSSIAEKKASALVFTAASIEIIPYSLYEIDTLTEIGTLELYQDAPSGAGSWIYTLNYTYQSEYGNEKNETVEAIVKADGRYDRIITEDISGRLPDGGAPDFDTVVVGTVSKTRLASLKATLPDGGTLQKTEVLEDVIFDGEENFTNSLLWGMGAGKSQVVYFYIDSAENTLLSFDTQDEG